MNLKGPRKRAFRFVEKILFQKRLTKPKRFGLLIHIETDRRNRQGKNKMNIEQTTEGAARWLAICIERRMPTMFALKSLELYFLNESKENRKKYL